MKAKQLFLLLAVCAFIYSCDQKSSKKTEPTVKEEVPKKEAVIEAPYVYGIDISVYQGAEINRLSPERDTLGFIFCKATQGANFTDPRFQQNWTMIKEEGFIRGAYHFYMSSDDPTIQALHFAKTIASIEATDIAPVIDFEMGGIDQQQSVAYVVNGLEKFISTLQGQLGRKPIIYTDIPTANKYLQSEEFASYALWVANYVQKPQPDLPTAWENAGWTFWQRSDTYKINGVENDSDVFNGDISKLKDFIKNYR